MVAKTLFRYFLVGADDRGLADNAVVAAAHFCRTVEGVLEIAHVIPRVKDKQDEILATTDAVQRMRGRLLTLAKANGLPAEALNHFLKVYPGDPGEVVSHRAVEWPADIVFLGPHAKRGIIDLGSTASSVFASTSCCVWVQPVAFSHISSVLVATDLSRASAEALVVGYRIAARLGGTLKVLYCGEDASAAHNEIQTRLADRDEGDVPTELATVDEKPVDAILSRQGVADLLVLGTRGRSGIGSALLGSVSTEVMRRSEIPVVVVPPPNM